jgi:thiosulfate/3-mercaptopyruvate sulfurtransferase
MGKFLNSTLQGENMKRFRDLAVFAVFLLLTAALLTGCGSSSESQTTGSTQTTAALQAASPDYPNADLLVSAESVQKSLGAVNLVIIDARSSGYATSHIPGAINVKFGDYFTGGTGLKATATLESQLGAAGLTRDKKIVIYDDTTASWGAAGRIFWMLEYLGCHDVHILDGGWDKWVADGRPTETAARTLAAATFTAQLNAAIKPKSKNIAYRLYDRDFAIIDTRTDEEFIGWQLYGEARGGHIKNAVHLPYAWLFNSDKTTLRLGKLKLLLESKGITPDKEITAYCTAGIRSAYMYFVLRLMGYERISNYDASILEWAAKPELPMEKAPRFSTVVYPAWVKAVIEYHKTGSTSAQPPEYPYNRDHKYLIFETQWGSFNDMQQGWADNSYLLGHIPGAIHSNSDIYENGEPRWFLNPDAELQTTMGSMGIAADTTVIVYSNSPIFAARLWWILKYAGVQDVRYLNGGYEQWTASGYAGETTTNNPVPVAFAGAVQPGFIATTNYVNAKYTDTANILLADVRSGSENAGIISGYSYLFTKGRIPNSVWANDADDKSIAYHDADRTLRSYTEIRGMWKLLGIKSTAVQNQFDREVIFYCGGGYRSSLTFLYAYMMGYDNIRNYSDGWAGWSTTYTQDPACNDGAQGWCQNPSGRPFETGW